MPEQLAVWGSPIDHSRSPLLHSTAYAALGLDWEYSRRDVSEDVFSHALGDASRTMRGLSLTMPLKYRAAQSVDERDAVASRTGAVNTVRFVRDGEHVTSFGYNTDVAGIVGALRGVGLDSATRAVVVGAGATASSAVVACAELGVAHVDILARNPERALATVEIARQSGVTAEAHPLDHEATVIERPDLVISTLPGSVSPRMNWTEEICATSVLLDVAYDPWPSTLADLWLRHGGVAANGLSMLVRQALIQVRIFVANDPTAELDNEDDVLHRMLDAVGLDAAGHPLPDSPNR